MTGKVYLVGAGPGDPGLMTMRGMELLKTADIVVFDALLSKELLNECKDAELIDVGKRGGNHKKTQQEINTLLIELGKQDSTIVRLKGGDPFLFGRGAEEVRELRKAGIEVHVVPGVTSAVSVPELAGIPVTHRDHSSNVTFLTGHLKADGQNRTNWKALVESNGTIVILMGMENVKTISEELIAAGASPDTDAAVIVDGSSERQRKVTTTLEDLPIRVEKDGLKAPGIIVIGSVVKESEILGDLR
jgi:uroporphyrin-III C-methyltransferase